MDITALWSENKKYVLIGAGLLIAGGFVLWFRNYESEAQANSEAEQNAQSEQDAQLAGLLLQEPYSTGADASEVQGTTGTDIDTGSETVQQLVNSILNPTSGTSTTGTQSGTPSTSTGTTTTNQPVTSQPETQPGITPIKSVGKNIGVLSHITLS